MFTHFTRWRLLLIVVILFTGLAFLAASRAAAEDGLEVVASGLDNPRDLTFGPDGALYIAEAGRGDFIPGRDRDDALCFEGPEGEVCYGPSGAVTRVMDDVQERVVSGLPSIGAIEDGSGAAGPHSVAFDADGNMVVLIGLGADPALRDPGGPLGEFGMEFGQLALVDGGGWMNIVDVAAYEASDNPDGGPPDSNPFAILATDDGFVLADAGGNDLLHIDGTGVISTLAVFPEMLVDDPFGGGGQIPMQAVPTSVVMGPDGAYYIGQLTGFPFPPGGASVFRLEAGGEAEVYATGFTNILGLDFDAAGNLYVLEMAMNSLLSDDPTGALVRVTPTRDQTIVTSDLFLPTGLVIGDDGYAYISNGGILAGGGSIVRILVEEPTDVSVSGFGGGLSHVAPVIWLTPLAAAGLYLVWRRRSTTQG